MKVYHVNHCTPGNHLDRSDNMTTVIMFRCRDCTAIMAFAIS